MHNRKPANAQRLANIYYVTYWFSAFTFAFAALFTLPLIEEAISIPMFSLLIQISSGLMALAEPLELIVEPVPKWSLGICLTCEVGSILYFWSSLVYEQYNKGELYMMGAFFISLSFELKILAIVIQENKSIATILRQEKYKLIRFTCLAVGTLLFFGGSASIQLNEGRSWLAGGLNLAGGIFAIISVFLIFKKPQHVGYARFQQEMEIPTII